MEKIIRLKKILKKENLDGYLIPKNDQFFSEYVADCYDRLNYISNFSGSFGFALILKNKNYLFVDGRYTLQANKQSGRYFEIITFPNKMPKDIFINKKNIIVGFDPKLFTKKNITTFFNSSNFKFKPIMRNLIDKIWIRKFKKNKNKFYILPNHSIGNDYKFKVKKIVSFLKKNDADYHFITASENNAWLLNIRGLDAKYSPIPNSYILLDKNGNINFFCDLSKVPLSLKNNFNKTKFLNIETINKTLSGISKKKFVLDKNTCSIYFENIIIKKNKILNIEDPIYALKAIKNSKEIINIKKAHIIDGVALTKFLFWVKKNFYKRRITEMSASKKLFEFRKKNKKFKFLSFPTISGAGPNGAIIHYNASQKTNRVLKRGDIYLVDSGGQYEFGTTDVTRTISLNNNNTRIKNIFTRVLKGHIAVANFKLKKNSCGLNVDLAARKYLKRINYSHGTGHGVGYFLNVHEIPETISKK